MNLQKLESFYAECGMQKKFANHLWFRTCQGHLSLKNKSRIIGHACVAPRQPWFFILIICKIKQPFLKNFENYFRAIKIIWNYEIASFFILPKYQKKGHGKLLLKKVFQYCRQKNIPKIRLFVNKKNKDALEFYQKNLFYTKKVFKNKYLMERVVSF